jgi:hypothetical protein
MKTTDKREVKTAEFRVWCDFCSIRIAPNEEQISTGGKAYHQRCYPKTKSSHSLDIRGGER